MQFTIQLKPKAHQSTRFARGRCFKPAEVVAYQNAIGISCRLAMAKHKVKITEDPLKCEIVFTFKGKKEFHTSRPDVDNLVKPVFDSMNGILYKDDSQIVELKVRKEYGAEDMIYISFG